MSQKPYFDFTFDELTNRAKFETAWFSYEYDESKSRPHHFEFKNTYVTSEALRCVSHLIDSKTLKARKSEDRRELTTARSSVDRARFIVEDLE